VLDEYIAQYNEMLMKLDSKAKKEYLKYLVPKKEKEDMEQKTNASTLFGSIRLSID
jgi:hypothetical protein